MTGAPFGAATVNLDAGYTYDDEGHLASVQYPVSQWNADNTTVPGPAYTYGYDSMGRLNTLMDQNSNTLVNGVSYGPANQMFQLNANSFTETRTYNANLQLIELASGSSIHYKYNYSPNQNNGRLQSQNDVISGETITYQYDTLNRLIQASGTGDPGGAWNQNFAYDGFANLLQKTASNAPANLYLGTDPQSNRLNTGGAIYDSNGNLTGNGTGIYAQTYAYDTSNRLKATTYASGAQTIYGYDHSNQRVYKAGYDASTGSYSNEQIAFYGIDGQKLVVWSLDLSGGNLNLTTTAINQWFDGRLVKSQDRLSSMGKYYPYGEDRGSANPANDQEKFATYTRDADSGLDYASQRYYSAPLARFMTADPSSLNVDQGNPGSWNMYSYVDNDPENATDATGMFLSSYAGIPGHACPSYAFCGNGSAFLTPEEYQQTWNFGMNPNSFGHLGPNTGSRGGGGAPPPKNGNPSQSAPAKGDGKWSSYAACLVAANVKILTAEGIGIGAITALGKAPSNPVPPPAGIMRKAPEPWPTTGLKWGKFGQVVGAVVFAATYEVELNAAAHSCSDTTGYVPLVFK